MVIIRVASVLCSAEVQIWVSHQRAAKVQVSHRLVRAFAARIHEVWMELKAQQLNLKPLTSLDTSV